MGRRIVFAYVHTVYGYRKQIKMFAFNQLKKVHIEISNRCQASCPMCPRTIHGGINNPLLPANDWSYENFVKVFNRELLDQLTDITFCGTFGDPMMNNDFIKMCQYLKDNSPNICVSIHTNGSARTPEWWVSLYHALPSNHYLVFALDGLADTQHLYRVGTNWHKIITNARAFIDAGGVADWMFIRFKHNEHQVEEAERLAKEYGFKRFTVKNTRRFETPKFTVLDKKGNVSHVLEQPSDTPVRFVNKKDLETYNSWPNKHSINCYALDQHEVYIDACYTLLPCCLLGAFIYTNYDKTILEKYNVYHDNSVVDFGKKIQDQVLGLINNELGGFDNNNVTKRSVKDIIDDPAWQKIWNEKWETGGSIGCIALCSKDSPYITVDDQWVEGKDPYVQV